MSDGRLYRRVVSSLRWPASSATITRSLPLRTSTVRNVCLSRCAESFTPASLPNPRTTSSTDRLDSRRPPTTPPPPPSPPPPPPPANEQPPPPLARGWGALLEPLLEDLAHERVE